MGYTLITSASSRINTYNYPATPLLLTIMKGFLFFTSSIAFVLGAPQFLSEKNQNENCHTEVVTIFEESTTTTSTSTTTSTKTSPSTTESTTVNEFGSVSTEEASRMDVSKIIFSDEAINSRNKELSNRVYVGRIPTTTVRIPDRRRNQNTNSQIFFPDK